MEDIVKRLREPWDQMQSRRVANEEEAATTIEKLRSALEPFAAAFDARRALYIARYPDAELGAANFDKMPNAWDMEGLTFDMGTYRRAREALGEGE